MPIKRVKEKQTGKQESKREENKMKWIYSNDVNCSKQPLHALPPTPFLDLDGGRGLARAGIGTGTSKNGTLHCRAASLVTEMFSLEQRRSPAGR